MPLSDKQLKVLAFPYAGYDTLICDGSIRSGKSSLMMVSFVNWAMETFNGQKFIIIGFTYGTAVRNVIDPFLAMTWTKQRYKCDFKMSKGELVVKRGKVSNTFFVFGADTERSFRKIQGFTAAGALIDETALCVKSAVDQALARCSVDGARFFFNCNPDAPTHWFYTDWILQPEKHNALRLHFTLEDNPGLSESTKERYRNQYAGVFKQRYIDGDWVIAEGLVYPFEREKYTVPSDVAEGAQDGTEGEYYISIDYGITNPFAALLCRVYDGVAYIVDEYYFDSRKEGRRKTDAEHYESLEELAGDLPIQEVIIDPSANSFKEEIWRHGRFMVRDANNAVIDGISTMMQLIDKDQLKVAQRCYNFIQEMGLYVWSDKANRDEVVKANDHCITGDTLIATDHGEIPIKELVGKCGYVWSYDGEKAVLNPFSDVRMTRENAEVYEIKTDDGRTLKCTSDHLIMTDRGWVECQNLTNEDRIISI